MHGSFTDSGTTVSAFPYILLDQEALKFITFLFFKESVPYLPFSPVVEENAPSPTPTNHLLPRKLPVMFGSPASIAVPMAELVQQARKGSGLQTNVTNRKALRGSCQETGNGTANRAGAPEIQGYMNFGVTNGNGYGAFYFQSAGSYGQMSPVHNDHYHFSFEASRCSSIYGSSETVMPASINIPIILYLGK